MRIVRPIIFAVALNSITLIAQQTEWTEFIIPESIQTSQSITSEFTNWQPFDGSSGECPQNVIHRIDEISVYDGHPRECASLVPASESRTKKSLITIWKLSPVSPEGTWVKCSYTHTRMSLCLSLPKTAKELRLTSNVAVLIKSQPVKIEFR